MPCPISTVLITGAGSGLGLSLVHRWVGRGKRVVATARVLSRPLSRLCRANPGELRYFPLDVASDQSLLHLGQRLSRAGLTIDLLIHHASVRQIVSLDRLDFSRQGGLLPFSFEMLAALRVSYAVLPWLSPGARVVCLASPPGRSSEFGSLAQPPRVSPAAVGVALRGLAVDLQARQGLLAVLYPGGPGGPGGHGGSAGAAARQREDREQGEAERGAWVTETIDRLQDRPVPEPPQPLLFRRRARHGGG